VYENAISISIHLHFFVLFLASPVTGFAQTSLPDLNTAPGIPQNLHTMTQTVLLEVTQHFPAK
jgi:hypothetical protein